MSTSRLWLVPALRAVATAIPGAVVAFVQDHSPFVGFIVVAIAALGTGVALLIQPAPVGSWWSRTAASWSLVFGLTALVAALMAGDGALLRVVVGAWALGVAVLEAIAWWQTRGSSDPVVGRTAIDHRAVAVMSLLFGVTALVFTGDDVLTVGMLGAYLVIVGVFFGIAAASLRSMLTQPEPVTQMEESQ